MGSTITLDIEQAQIAFVGATQADGTFEIAKVLKGEELLDGSLAGLTISAATRNTPSLVLGNKLPEGPFDWQDVRTLSQIEFGYVVGAIEATKTERIDLGYFFPFLGDPRQVISDDAYYQFARSNYASIRQYQADYDRERIIELIESSDTMPELRVLAFTLLGIVGNEEDAYLPLRVMEQDRAVGSRGLAAVMSCYLALAGEGGLNRLRDNYLANPNANYEMTFAAIEAIRFHLKETDKIDRRQLLNALHRVIDNPEISDVVIPDLIEQSDWTAIDEVAELFRKAPKDKQWIRVAAAEYLIAAPSADTQFIIAQLRKTDASAFVQAETGRPSIPENVRPAANSASKSFFDLATVFLASPLLATAFIAVVIAIIIMMILRLFSKKTG